MPASFVHQSVAGEALKRLSSPPGEDVLPAALAGAEGPDPLFFSLAPAVSGPYPPRVGSALHTKNTADFLLALCEACAGDALLRAYCLGFFTHYAADTTFHPFVYAHSVTPDGKYSGTLHCTLEHGLETLHYRRTGHASGLPVQMAGYAALSREKKANLARPFAAAIATALPELALSESRVLKSFQDAVDLCALLRSESGRKYRLLGGALRPLGLQGALYAHMMPPEPPEQDIANDARVPWASPWEPDRSRDEGFTELYAAAVDRAAELCEAALGVMRGRVAKASLRALLGDFSYDSGLPWRESCRAEEAIARLSGKA